jgi:collagenase-like PrtC family protease
VTLSPCRNRKIGLDYRDKLRNAKNAAKGAEAVTIALPSLLEIVKKHFPGLKICVSLFSIVDNLDYAKRWEDLGADKITFVD